MTRTITASAPGPRAARRAAPAPHPLGRATRSTYEQLLPRKAAPSWPVVAVTLASIVIAGFLYIGAELVLALLGRPPLIAAPGDVMRTLSQVDLGVPAVLVMVILLAGVATVLVRAAPRPGHRARPGLDSALALEAAIAYDAFRPTLQPTVMLRPTGRTGPGPTTQPIRPS